MRLLAATRATGQAANSTLHRWQVGIKLVLRVASGVLDHLCGVTYSTSKKTPESWMVLDGLGSLRLASQPSWTHQVLQPRLWDQWHPPPSQWCHLHLRTGWYAALQPYELKKLGMFGSLYGLYRLRAAWKSELTIDSWSSKFVEEPNQ